MCTVPQRLDFTDKHFAESNVSVASVVGGGGHVFILDERGRLFGCGWNHQGQLGIDTAGKDSSTFRLISTKCLARQTIDRIACGWDVSAAVCTDGSLFVWGSNARHQLGMSKSELSFSSTPIQLRLPHDEKVKIIAFNLQTTCVWTTNDTIYLFGNLKQYESSLPFDDRLTSKLVRHNDIDYLKLDLNRIDGISVGQNHVLAYRKECGSIFGIGNNKHLQSEAVAMETKIDYLCSGWTHNAALTAAGNVWLWGRNNYGQCGKIKWAGLKPTHGIFTQFRLLGVDPALGNVSTPKKLNFSENIKQIRLGAEHGIVLSESGKVFTWGWNEHGNCGNGSTENLYY